MIVGLGLRHGTDADAVQHRMPVPDRSRLLRLAFRLPKGGAKMSKPCESSAGEVECAEQDDVVPRPCHWGPAFSIALGGLLGGMMSVPFLAMKNPVGFILVLGGCMAGGIVYRIHSRHWPVDPGARLRQIVAALSLIHI